MRRATILIIAALIVGCLASKAECQRTRRRGGPAVREIKVMGADHFSDKQIKSVMRTKESKFLRTKRLRESTLESDLISIKAFYRKNGFLKAQVEEERTYDDEADNVWIQIMITEGPQTLVGDVQVEGNVLMDTKSLRRLLEVKIGKPFNEQQVGEDKYRLYSYYADNGFVFATIEHKTSLSDGEATVKYLIREGEPAPIGRISVRGNRRVTSPIIRREVTLRPGDTFSSKKMIDSQQKILDTGLFKDVDIEPRASEVDSVSVDLVVKVKERKMRELSFRVGYGTRDEARLSVGWLHRNLWKSGRQVELRSTTATRDFQKGLTRMRGDVAFTDRWLFGMRLVGVIGIYGEETLEEYKEVENGEYTLDRLGINLSVKKDIFRVSKLTLAYTHEIVHVRDANWSTEEDDDLRLQVGQEVNRSLSVLLVRDTRRPFFDPLGGSVTRLGAQRAGGVFGGDNSFNKVSMSWSRYLGPYFGTVVALSSRVGYANAYGASKDKGVPEYERFYAGGSGTIRGYGEREFGPGDFLLLANVEMRYRLFWRLVGVAFFDMGNAWPSIEDVRGSDFSLIVDPEDYATQRDSDVKYTAGLGIGMQTPVGPFRIDYGFRIKRGIDEEGNRESLGRLHLIMGHAF